MPDSTEQFFAFECRLSGEDGLTIINARTSGEAKAEFFSELDGGWRFTDIRVRKAGPVHTSAAFERNAAYRRWNGVKCGQRVRLKDGGELGTIVGHNSSANFDVAFDLDTKFKGRRANCHPSDLERVS